MNIKERMKSYSFWVSLASAIILILKVIGTKFGFDIDENFASDLITSLCSILVLLGIIVTPTQKVIQENNQITETSNPSPEETPDKNLVASNNTSETFEESENILSVIENSEVTKQDDIIETAETPVVINNINESLNNFSTPLTILDNHSEQIFDCGDAKCEAKLICVENTDDESANTKENEFELLEIFKTQKEKFSNDLIKYIQLLESEINSLKQNNE